MSATFHLIYSIFQPEPYNQYRPILWHYQSPAPTNLRACSSHRWQTGRNFVRWGPSSRRTCGANSRTWCRCSGGRLRSRAWRAGCYCCPCRSGRCCRRARALQTQATQPASSCRRWQHTHRWPQLHAIATASGCPLFQESASVLSLWSAWRDLICSLWASLAGWPRYPWPFASGQSAKCRCLCHPYPMGWIQLLFSYFLGTLFRNLGCQFLPDLRWSSNRISIIFAIGNFGR